MRFFYLRNKNKEKIEWRRDFFLMQQNLTFFKPSVTHLQPFFLFSARNDFPSVEMSLAFDEE